MNAKSRDLDVEPVGDPDVRAAHQREHGQLDVLGGKLGVVEVEVRAAHDVYRRRPLAQPPAAAAVAAAHDRHEPARAALPAPDRQPVGGRLRHLVGHYDVDDEPLDLRARARRVGGVEPLVQLLHREPALAGGAAQRVGGPLPVGVGGAQLGQRLVHDTAAPAASANGGTSSMRSPLENRPGAYQLAGRREGSSPICW
jgi:hypothetical protein